MKNINDTELELLIKSSIAPPLLPPGSRERFMKRLEKAEREKKRRLTWRLLTSAAIAASLLLFFFITPGMHRDEAPPTEADLMIAEVRGYYRSLLWNETEFITNLCKELDPKTRDRLMDEVTKINMAPDSLVADIDGEHLSEDEKIYHIASIYQSHLRSLQYIHTILNEGKQARLSKQQ